MSVIVSSSCTDNGSVSRLSNGLQDASIVGSSSKTLLSNIEQGRRNTTNSFRSSSAWIDNNREWDTFFQQSVVHGNENQEFPNFFMSEDEEEEEYRQEWSDEHFTQLYVQQQHSLNLDKLHTRKRQHSSQNSFVQEFLQNSNDTNQKITNTFYTNHCDLFQAQLYLIDHLLSAILTCPITTTRRPSSTAEWNWDRLFSPARWYDKGDVEDHEDNDILQNEYLKRVAIERLQLLMGHIINTDDDKRKEGWEWEWEFYNS
ncbi:hypothetical protein RclHR1_00790018 [Rhizophagus clarus]|uniref:Uncharacterized protein n=1 Tax=Rhizophagus clarus TaxID=94130 RepID=A0A2Z6RY91_9GLOM|nr:hypothetical protein RclHR1_00790018 [Rhizophagus clarus]GES90668.1 hypothetical protein GLOIN_2v1475727 [Rhizophagus clarus]